MTPILLILQAVPWYLFPGSNPVKTEPVAPRKDTIETVTTIVPEAAAPRDSIVAAVDTFVLDIPETISVSILLPFTSGDGYNEGVVDFYSGALMAFRELGERGFKLNINTYDTSSGTIPEACFGSEVILGPIGAADLEKAAKSLPDGKWIVSPLEPKAAVLCDSLRVIQLPTSQSAQYRDLVKWLGEESAPDDRIFVLKNSSENFQEADSICSVLSGLGLKYTVTGDISEFTDPDKAEVLRSEIGTFRMLIASENDFFISECIRKVRVMSMLKYNVALYAPSKARSIETINIEHLHNCSTRISSTYFTDYTVPSVRQFVYSYRALFHAEPNHFAFDGYDTANHLLALCSKYGRMWPQRIHEFSSKGLQMNFAFRNRGKQGAENTATVRVVYEPDFSVRKVQ